MLRRLLFGQPGIHHTELRLPQRWAALAYTWCNVVLVHGESWRDYRERWIRR